jgi:two-component system chemotaxis sensor kinase CheA
MGLEQNELWQGYLGDSADAFQDIEQSLLALEGDPRQQAEINRLYRGLHTLKGNSGFMGLAQIERLAHATEDLVGLVRDRGVPLDHEICEILLAVHDRLRSLVAEASERQRDVEAARVDDLVTAVKLAHATRKAACENGAAPRAASVPPPQAGEVILFAGGLADVPMESLVPSADPGYLEVFLTLAQERMGAISAGLGALANAGDPAVEAEARASLTEGVTDLQHAAERMGFGLIDLALGDLVEAAGSGKTDPSRLAALERELYSELVKIEETYRELTGGGTSFGFLALARRSAADQVFASLAKLRSLVDAIAAGQSDEAHEIPALYREIRVACEHYGFDAAARVCLDNEDRFARSEDAGVIDASLVERTRELVAKVGAAIDAVNQGEDCVDVPGLSVPAPDKPTSSDVARFGLSRELEATLTRELVERLDALLARGDRLHQIRAVLDEPATAEAFQRWSNGETATYVTSATVFRDDRTEFDFLVASPLGPDGVAARLREIDPTGRALTLRGHDAPPPSPPKPPSPPTPEPRVSARSQAEELPASFEGNEGRSPEVVDGPRPATEVTQIKIAPERAEAEPAKEGGAGAQQVEYLRIDARKIGLIMDLAGEIGLATGAVTQNGEVRRLELEGFNAAAHKLEMLIRELQTEVSSMRLVPVSGVFQRMKRVVRDAAKRTGKQVELVLRGEDTEIDKFMVDSLHDPLVHLLRNAIDHGLETPEERVAAGKPATGRIVLEATHEAGEVTITVADDGRGIDRERVLARAIQRGLVDPSAKLGEAEILDLIFKPGFSTKEVVSELSGRGVGMDVVKTTIEGQLRGRVGIRSQSGKGSRFVLRMPLTLAFIEAMVVEEHGRLYVVPIEKVLEVFQVSGPSQLVPSSSDGELLVRIRGQLVPVCWVHRFYGDEAEPGDSATQILGKIVVIVQTALGKLALPVDALLGNQQVMLKPLKGVLSNVRAAAGCGMLRSGDVAVALDCERLHA